MRRHDPPPRHLFFRSSRSSSSSSSCVSLYCSLLFLLLVSSHATVAAVNNNQNNDGPFQTEKIAGVTIATTSQSCDDSKCRATRLHPWVDGDTEWTCWVPMGTNVQDLCPEGYEGKLIPDHDSTSRRQIDGIDYEWFTCCPHNYDGPLEQTCSDLACSSPDWEGGGNCWADGFQEPMTCGSSKYRHPRWTGLMSLIYIQYVCCTTPDNTDTFMQELFIARIIWMTLSAITLLVCSIFIGGILRSPYARSQGYNLYLVFLAIPDALANLMILVRNGLTISGTPAHPTVHIFLASSEYFYASSNMWLNAVIVGQIHQILRKSNVFVKIQPPTVQRVCMQASLTYGWALLWFGWAFALYYQGLVWFSLSSVVNVWIVTRVLMVAPPLLYVVGVCFHVWKYQLLPRSGRTRVLSLYFLRVVIVFMVTWVPYFVIYEIAWNVTHSRWMVHVSYYLGSIQGFLSVLVAMSKPDVKRAIYQFLCCKEPDVDDPMRASRFASTLALGSHSSRYMMTASGRTAGTSMRLSSVEFGASSGGGGGGSSTTMDDNSPQFQMDISTSVEFGLDRSHQDREERRARAQVNPLEVSSRSLRFTKAEEEWDAEDVWEEGEVPAASANVMSAITEEEWSERQTQEAAESTQTCEEGASSPLSTTADMSATGISEEDVAPVTPTDDAQFSIGTS